MQVVDLITSESIITSLRSGSKRDVLSELIDAVTWKNQKLDRESVLSVLLERERLGSTGIGDGVAIPHGKLKNLDGVMVSFGRSCSGIPFDSVDGKPVHLFFLLLAPENSASLYLRILAKISRLLKNPALKQKLLSAESAQNVIEAIRSEET